MPEFRDVCDNLTELARAYEHKPLEIAPLQWANAATGACSSYRLDALWNWAKEGGGPSERDNPASLRAEAFEVAQNILRPPASEALARAGAKSLAQSAGVGQAAEDYEATLDERADVTRMLARTVGQAEGDQRLVDLNARRAQLEERLAKSQEELVARAPRYWDFRRPEALKLAELQSLQGPDAVLLHDNEALISVLVANGEKYGFVFAISKEKAAWARLGLPGSTIRSHVLRLRTEIDNVGASIVEKSVPFERALAFDLYNAILGAPEIRQVIDEKEDLIFVPSGELTFLPPALFVSSPPDGGSAKDADPNALRATAWLLRSKTITVLPSVSSLRTLRQLFLQNQMSASEPLLALANPQFSEARQPVQTVEATPRPRSLRAFNDYYHDGQPLAALLHQLPDIPGTAEEARQLQSILGAPLDSVLTGDDASKAALTARNLDGRLAKVRVLDIATHGFFAGEIAGLAQPAIILAYAQAAQDQLFTVSDAALLKLNADWVILSACNTASPDASEARGISGFARAFFYAGAKSLLVSHWRLRDDVAAKLVPDVLKRQKESPNMSNAGALREASLAILDNPDPSYASPAAWAPFVLVGEPR